MIYIDADNETLLINEKLVDLKTWTIIDNVPLFESMSAEIFQHAAYLKLNEETTTTIDGKEGMLSQGTGWLLKQAKNVVANLPYTKAFEVLRKFFPTTLEGWVHFGVDTLSLILDVLGPFTLGLGNAASMAIDVIHGIYYIGAGFNWPGFPNRSDRVWEYSLCGAVTLGFALIPGGNVGTLAFRKFLQNNPLTKGSIGPFLIKLFDSALGAQVKKIFNFFAKNIGRIGKLLESVIGKLVKIPFIGKLFELLGLKKLATKVIAGLDEVLVKFFKNPEVKAALKKQGIVASTKKVEKDAAKSLAAEGVIKKMSKGKNLFAAGELTPAYAAIVKRLKMTMVPARLSITAGTLAYDKIVSLLTDGGKATDTKEAQSTIDQVGMDKEAHEKWLIKYAYMLEDEDVEDKKLDSDEIGRIQQYLIDNSAVYSKNYTVEKTGTITVQMMGAMSELFEFMSKPVEGLEGEDKAKVEKFAKFCKEGLKELNNMNISYAEKVKNFASDVQDTVKDKVEDVKDKVVESHVKSFKDFIK